MFGNERRAVDPPLALSPRAAWPRPRGGAGGRRAASGHAPRAGPEGGAGPVPHASATRGRCGPAGEEGKAAPRRLSRPSEGAGSIALSARASRGPAGCRGPQVTARGRGVPINHAALTVRAGDGAGNRRPPIVHLIAAAQPPPARAAH
jgi:hypothetical protein